MSNQIKIVIADDHPLVLSGMRHVVEKNENFEIIAEFNSGENVFQFISNHTPDIAILDIRMPVCSGLELLKKISNTRIQTKVILLTMHKNLNYFYTAVSFGAKGYIFKDSAVIELDKALNTIINGGVFISNELEQKLNQKKNTNESQQLTLLSINSLTATEKKVLKFVAEWKSTKEISEILFTSERTVSNHRNHIIDKLNLKGSNKLIRFAIENKELFE